MRSSDGPSYICCGGSLHVGHTEKCSALKAQQISKSLSNEELADLIHEFADILHKRCNNLSEGSPLKRQLDAARLSVRSWPSWKQRTFENKDENHQD